MPPVLAKTQSNTQQQQSTSNTDGQQNTSNNNNNAWMNTHWAYIDPSTYVQWSVSISESRSYFDLATNCRLPLASFDAESY